MVSAILSVDDVWSLIDREVQVLTPVRRPLGQAGGHRLAENICADEDMPAFTRAAIDGYALPAGSPPGRYRIVGEIRPGMSEVLFPRNGEAVKIFTCSVLPEEGVELVMIEDVAGEGDRIVTSTGSELVPVTQKPAPGCLRDSNSPIIAALVEKAGTALIFHGRISERVDQAVQALGSAGEDLILISGGASVGEHDASADFRRAPRTRPARDLVAVNNPGGGRSFDCRSVAMAGFFRPDGFASGQCPAAHQLRGNERAGRSIAFWQSGILSEFSRLDAAGSARMVDVGREPEQQRVAVASGRIVCRWETIAALKNQALPKGDALTGARIAGVQVAKSTAQLILLCRPLPLNHVAIDFEIGDASITVRCEAATRSATGVEMEALTGVSVAALSPYDMMKSADKTMRIEGIMLLEKTENEGRAGDDQRPGFGGYLRGQGWS